MARPRSDDKRSAILTAATRIIAAQGLGAPTATIAREAGVSNGSLFTYFATKGELLNQLYLALKTETAAAALDELPTGGDTRAQLQHAWSHWLRWAVSFPEKRRALAHLAVAEEITPESRRTGNQAMAGVAELLERGRANGPMHAAPLSFVTALLNAMAETTIDFMIQDPDSAEKHETAAIEAVWRMIG